jgi:beta-1,4-mannosyl-glycoprotein beta-1,4-N-acetylglucosaminyltransferase
MPVRIFDCFTFFNELELLELRLHELYETVDQFVVVEAPVTFQGKPKPLFYEANVTRFRHFAQKIRHIVVWDMPGGSETWPRERHQRNAIKQGLGDASPGDFVLVSDVDEIPATSTLAAASLLGSFSFFEQRLAAYFIDWEVIDGPDVPWSKAYGAPWKIVQAMPDLTEPRFNDPSSARILGKQLEVPVIQRGGWHFSWLGGIDRILQKLNAFSHTEALFEVWKDSAKLEKAVADRIFFTRGARLQTVGLDQLPPTVTSRRHRLQQQGLLSPDKAPRSALEKLRTWAGIYHRR